jgi:hypothetical protein
MWHRGPGQRYFLGASTSLLMSSQSSLTQATGIRLRRTLQHTLESAAGGRSMDISPNWNINRRYLARWAEQIMGVLFRLVPAATLHRPKTKGRIPPKERHDHGLGRGDGGESNYT